MMREQTFVLPSVCNATQENGTDTDSAAWGATVISPILMSLAGTVGNILALIVLRRTKTRGVFYTLVAGLAWTDLLGILLTSPATIATYANGRRWVGGPVFCKLNGFLMVCFGLATTLIVCAMAVERFLSVRCAFIHSKQCNRGSARVTLVILWISVMILGILPLFGFGRFTVQYPCTWCFLDFHSRDPLMDAYAYLYSVINLTVIVVMSICNVYVMVTLLHVRYLKQRAGSQRGNIEFTYTTGNKKKKKQRSVELQMFVLLFAITIVFTTCWVPLMIHILVTIISGVPNHFVALVTVRLASINQTLDPWMYILLRKSIIRKICRFGRRVFCVKHQRTGDSDEIQDRNFHARHLRCYRKHCHMPTPHFHLQGHITPSGRCVVQFKRRSNQIKIKSTDENQGNKLSLPDVMKDAHSKSPSAIPDVAGLYENDEICIQCQSLHASHVYRQQANMAATDLDQEAAQENVAMAQDNETTSGDESDTSQSKPCELCTAMEQTKPVEDMSSDEDSDSDSEEDTDVFLTKTTDLSSDQLGALPKTMNKARRGKLKSEVNFPQSYFRLSG
ncbi:hypothetical protein FSP39_008745 [Pinctada imbricata]|uniref:Thromboxane A2 receptor n=1 Tax=Pinctada imbricata TaxID=66713 RepID=A0AA89BQA3_PINIB|nr:hypothetical protein FSP39_008745 [Pinctada imbricata]